MGTANHLMCMGMSIVSSNVRFEEKEGSGMLDFSMPDPLFSQEISHHQRCLAAAYFPLPIVDTCILSQADCAKVYGFKPLFFTDYTLLPVLQLECTMDLQHLNVNRHSSILCCKQGWTGNPSKHTFRVGAFFSACMQWNLFATTSKNCIKNGLLQEWSSQRTWLLYIIYDKSENLSQEIWFV